MTWSKLIPEAAFYMLLLMAAINQPTHAAGLPATKVSACVGEMVTLPCYSAERMGVDWMHEDNNYVVASGFVQNDYKNRFSLNQTAKHQHSLVISGLQVSDQGVYVCVEDAGLGPRHPYRLTVHVACKSLLAASSAAPSIHNEDGNNTALVGVAIVVFVVILALTATVALGLRSLGLRSRRHGRHERKEYDDHAISVCNGGTKDTAAINDVKEATTPQPVDSEYEDEHSRMNFQDKITYFQNLTRNDTEAPLKRQSPVKQDSFLRKLLSCLRKPSQSKTT